MVTKGKSAARDPEAPARARRIVLRAVAFFEPGATDAAAVQRAVVSEEGELMQVLPEIILAAFGSAAACLRTCRVLASRVRAGASCGDVLDEGGLLFGLPVIEASRLKDRAAPGQVLCAQRLLAVARFPEHSARPIGAFVLKGLPDPLTVSEILPG